jgi:hypothetical protein
MKSENKTTGGANKNLRNKRIISYLEMVSRVRSRLVPVKVDVNVPVWMESF